MDLYQLQMMQRVWQEPFERPPSLVPPTTLGGEPHPAAAPAPQYQVIEVIPKTEFSQIGERNRTQLVVLEKYVDVSAYEDVVGITRVHAVSLVTDQSFEVVLQRASPAQDDPGEMFVTTVDESVMQITDSTMAPTMLRREMLDPPSHIRVVLRGTQAPSASGMSVTVSVSLVLRSHRVPCSVETPVGPEEIRGVPTTEEDRMRAIVAKHMARSGA